MPEDFFANIEDISDAGNSELANSSLFGIAPDDIEPITEEDEETVVKKPIKAIPKQSVKQPVIKGVSKEEEKEEEEDEKEKFDANSFFGKEDDEDEEENIEKEEDKEEDEQSAKEDEINPFESLSADLYKSGVFERELDEEGNDISPVAKTPEELKQLFDTQSQGKATRWIERFLSQFGEEYREAFDAIYVNGADPKEYFSTATEIASLQNISLDNESNQKKVVREFYKRAGMPEDKIDRKISWLIDTAHLEEEATDMLPQLVEQETRRLEELEQQSRLKIENERRADVEYKSAISKVLTEKLKTKEFDGIPVSEQKAQKAFDFLYSKKWKTSDGKLMTDFDVYIANLNKPENYAKKVKLGLLLESDLDLSKVQTRALSKETTTLFASVASKHKATKKAAPAKSTWGESL